MFPASNCLSPIRDCPGFLPSSLQYNTTDLWYRPSSLCNMRAKLKSALSRLGGGDAIVMQSIVNDELAQGP